MNKLKKNANTDMCMALFVCCMYYHRSSCTGDADRWPAFVLCRVQCGDGQHMRSVRVKGHGQHAPVHNRRGWSFILPSPHRWSGGSTFAPHAGGAVILQHTPVCHNWHPVPPHAGLCEGQWRWCSERRQHLWTLYRPSAQRFATKVLVPK